MERAIWKADLQEAKSFSCAWSLKNWARNADVLQPAGYINILALNMTYIH